MRIGAIHKIMCYSSAVMIRNRIVPMLLLLIPALFFVITRYTTSTLPVFFKLDSISAQAVVSAPQRNLAIIYIAFAVAGLLSSILSYYLIQDHKQEHKRLILCGLRSSEIIISKFLLMMTIIIGISAYTLIITRFFFAPESITGVFAGLILIGFVYGSYGMLIGSFSKGDLEGILFIVLLSNLDIGWLQNPIYYLGAQNKEFIKALPAFFPSQAGIISAFSGYHISNTISGSLIYGSFFLGIAMIIYHFRMRIRKVKTTEI